jgi:hypothetical protein
LFHPEKKQFKISCNVKVLLHSLLPDATAEGTVSHRQPVPVMRSHQYNIFCHFQYPNFVIFLEPLIVPDYFPL